MRELTVSPQGRTDLKNDNAHTTPPVMPSDNSSSQQPPSGLLPLGRNASRALVIASILFVLAASAGGTWLILSLARQGPPPQEAVAPADTTDTVTAPDAP